jgi:hypothetical protein
LYPRRGKDWNFGVFGRDEEAKKGSNEGKIRKPSNEVTKIPERGGPPPPLFLRKYSF